MKLTKDRDSENILIHFKFFFIEVVVRNGLPLAWNIFLTLTKEFLHEIMDKHLEKEKSKIISLENIHVFEGPNISSISITLSVRFDLTYLPDYNIEEKKHVKLFLKIPVFDEPNQTAVKLCSKEIQVYQDFFSPLAEFLDHPIKGPYCGPQPPVVFRSEVEGSGPSVLGI